MKLIDIFYYAMKNVSIKKSTIYLGRKSNLNIVVEKVQNWLYFVSIKDLTSFRIVAIYDKSDEALEFAINLKNKTEEELNQVPCFSYSLPDPKVRIKKQQEICHS